jgi:two-component system sensor histidine kinase PilS (NtrC family)
VASLFLYVGVATAVQSGVIIAQIGGERLQASRFVFLTASNALAISLVATLAAYLSRQLVSAGGQLVAKETEFENLEALQQRILLVMPSGLMTADDAGVVSFANPTALMILEQEADEVVGAPLDTVIPGARELGPHAVRREIEVATPGGRRVLGLSITPMTMGERDVLLVFQDLTELRRLERELQRSDRLAALGQLAAQLAHEIRNPLAAMRGSAQLLMKEVAGSEVGERLANILIRESDRLARLVDDSLRFARPAPPKRRRLSAVGLVEETAKMLRTDPLAEGATIQVTAPKDVEADIDPDQIRQVLLNLMRNGLQAAGAGGRLEIDVEASESSVLISVWDSGGGVPKEVLPRIFEPFFTTRKGGTGLGLATAHAIVQAHGGVLEIQESPRGGTFFSVRLPLNAPISFETPVPEGLERSVRSQ